MTELIVTGLVMLVIKIMVDISKFKWERSVLSYVKLLNWWRRLKSPFDLWHILMGLVWTYIGWDKLRDMGYQLNDLRLWLYTGIYWVIFFTAFVFAYHYGLMKPEWRDYEND